MLIFAGHFGKKITYKFIFRKYFWPDILENIKRYIKNCNICGKTKAWRNKLRKFLKSLFLLSQIWQEISIDFIIDFLKSNDYIVMVVIIDWLN